MKKVGIIRCLQTEDLCLGTTCLKVAAAGKLAFDEIGASEVVGIITCGGCPGKKAVQRAEMFVNKGVEVIVLASCIFKGTPIGFPCPNAEQMKAAIRKNVGDDIIILDYSH